MPEIQVMFRKQRIQIQHPSQSHDTYFQGTGTGVVQARLTRDRNRSRVTSRERESEQVSFKIPRSRAKSTLVHFTENCSRNQSYQSILLEDGVKVTTGILSGAGVGSEHMSVAAGFIHDP